MDVFKRNTKEFTFELKDKNLVICLASSYGELERDYLVDSRMGCAIYKIAGQAFAMEIYDYIKVMKSPIAGEVIQNVLATFSFTFKPQEKQREQLVRGLKYFVLADHYKVFKAAFPAEALEDVKNKYAGFNDSIDGIKAEYAKMELTANKFHISEPQVSSTGLLTYATSNHNWFVWETRVRHDTLPEYVWSVDKRINIEDPENSDILADIFEGRQDECQKFVMDQQKKAYGLCVEDLNKKLSTITFIERCIEDFEILLDIPLESTRAAKLEMQEAKEEVEQIAEANKKLLDQITADKT